MQVIHIEYDPAGDDAQGEYVRIENQGGTAQDMTGWTLSDEANHTFTFPMLVLDAGTTVNEMTDVTPVTNYPGQMNVILVTDQENLKKKPRTEEGLKKQKTDIHTYITFLPLRNPYRLYRLYSRRWDIENRVFRELGQNWHIHRLSGWSFRKIRAHFLFTIIAFNLTLLFKSKWGCRYTSMSMATLREEALMALRVVVYVGHEFGAFTTEEYTQLLLDGLAPPHSLPLLLEEAA